MGKLLQSPDLLLLRPLDPREGLPCRTAAARWDLFERPDRGKADPTRGPAARPSGPLPVGARKNPAHDHGPYASSSRLKPEDRADVPWARVPLLLRRPLRRASDRKDSDPAPRFGVARRDRLSHHGRPLRRGLGGGFQGLGGFYFLGNSPLRPRDWDRTLLGSRVQVGVGTTRVRSMNSGRVDGGHWGWTLSVQIECRGWRYGRGWVMVTSGLGTAVGKRSHGGQLYTGGS